MLLRPYIFIIAMFILSSCATTEVIRSNHKSDAFLLSSPEQCFIHIVQPNENIWHIGRIYGIAPDDLIQANRFLDPADIKDGQAVFIPRSLIRIPSKEKGFILPAQGKIVSWFNQEENGTKNKGISMIVKPGTEVIASQKGRISFIADMPGYGKTIIITHDDDISSVYCGVSDVLVKAGDIIQQNKQLGITGKGLLHFQIRYRHKSVNPSLYLN